jgi:hypothetical protein
MIKSGSGTERVMDRKENEACLKSRCSGGERKGGGSG